MQRCGLAMQVFAVAAYKPASADVNHNGLAGWLGMHAPFAWTEPPPAFHVSQLPTAAHCRGR